MENPATPQKSPYKVIVEKDKTYSWRACGLPQKQPFLMALIKKMGNINQLNIQLKKVKKYIFADAK